jgi:hypothetical protein
MQNQIKNPDDTILVDSVNYLDASARGRVVIASSHGGIYAAYKAAASGARAVILNDAGVGLQNAGIACLEYCQKIGMAAAVVSHGSARIGVASDMFERGIISHSNEIAENVNCTSRISCASAAAFLRMAPVPFDKPPAYEEVRFLISHEAPRIVCIDSASLVKEEDAGQIVITGSHGGLIGGQKKKAFNVNALLAVFNDAGVGIDQAGIGRLDPLDEIGIAAVTAAYTSARIGDSRSTYHEGIISHVNQHAMILGASLGALVKDFVQNVSRRLMSKNKQRSS